MSSTPLCVAFLLILFLILIYAFFYRDWDIESFKYVFPITRKSIGNFTSRYFGTMGLAFLTGKDFNASKTMMALLKKDPFFEHLPTFVALDKSIYEKMKSAKVKRSDLLKNPNSYWVIENPRAEAFWMAMRPRIREMLETAFQETGVSMHTRMDNPVIHFRCSDVPFVKNMHYHFVRYSFYRDCFKEAQKKSGTSYGKIMLLSCHEHNSNPDYMSKCRIYKASLVQYLEEELELTVMTRCGTPVQDFATMFYAPVVLSAGSSFSFMSGFFGHGMFFSEGHFTDLSGIPSKKYKESDGCGEECGEWLRSGYSLLHNEIDDYEDTDHVISLLTKK